MPVFFWKKKIKKGGFYAFLELKKGSNECVFYAFLELFMS